MLAFGKDYGMLEKGEKHWALELLDEGMEPLAFFLPTWLFRFLTAIPGLAAGYHNFIKFCVDELNWRIDHAEEQDKKGGTDIMSWILRAYKEIQQPGKDPMLQADARLIIVAGSDTTAATFTYMFYHLARNPEVVKTLREELRPLIQGDWADKDINQAEYLNGCIYEALRMHPPVPSGLQRLTPPGGMQIDGRQVPGNTVFYMPQYVMGRGKSNDHKPAMSELTKSARRPNDLPGARHLRPRTVVQQARDGEVQGCFRTVQRRLGRLHWKAVGDARTSDHDGKAGLPVQLRFGGGRRWTSTHD